jgi:hypothetical protein
MTNMQLYMLSRSHNRQTHAVEPVYTTQQNENQRGNKKKGNDLISP